GEEATRVAACRKIGLDQQPPGVGAHEQRTVAPGADEVAVVPAALDHHIGEAERQGAVAARPRAQPQIGLGGEPHRITTPLLAMSGIAPPAPPVPTLPTPKV